MARRPSRRSSSPDAAGSTERAAAPREPQDAKAPAEAKEPRRPKPSRGLSRRRSGRREGELTVDELAAETGMTVRNLRAYSSRGLLPPPRLSGRTGYYGPDHIARLTLVREMLDQGYTLTAAEKLITAAPGSGTQALGLYHALMTPWEEMEPEVVEPRSLAREAGIAFDRALIDRIIELGLATETDDALIRIENAALVRAGLQVIAAGVPAPAVLDIVPALRRNADDVAELFVSLFWDSLWTDFVDAGMPARQWPRIQQSLEEIIPIAGQALLAAFQESLGSAVTEAMRQAFAAIDADADEDGTAAAADAPDGEADEGDEGDGPEDGQEDDLDERDDAEDGDDDNDEEGDRPGAGRASAGEGLQP